MNLHDENQKLNEQVKQFKTMLDDARSVEGIVASLNKMQAFEAEGGFVDSSFAHEYADLFLLKALVLSDNADVADAYVSLKKRADGFWYS